MKTNLAETVKFCFTESVISQLANTLGESDERVKTGLAHAVPLVLNAILQQAEQEQNPAALLQRAREVDATNAPAQFTNLADASWYEQGGIILVELLGSTYGPTKSQIAHESGLLPPDAERLLQLAATSVFGVVGRFAAENSLTPSTFIQWLRWQKADISAAMLPTLKPLNTAAPAARPLATVAPRTLAPTPPRALPALDRPMALGVAPDAAPAGSPALRWQWGLLLLLAVGMGYFFGYGRQRPAPEAALAPAAWPGPTAAAAKAPASAAAGRYDQNRDTYIYDTGQPTVLTLADGKTQKVGANSTENRLYTFLATPTVLVDSVNRTKGWINFDRVYFETGQATLTPESAQQLQNVADIIKTFPKAMVKIGGYTDSSGVAAHNYKLSEERAKTAMFTLSTMGLPAQNIQFKGYGPQHFIVSNNTPQGRALNRRISIRVVKK
ncbi:OmpA family protein [Hymenobacter sp. H14-R3]|uniref:OmpA family protein n=1 Tax=Hymenobacter sp. H14-R3 TaxID=3046308 RepID=UPI0024B95259|nr:OmpA family protein [Hymenobacter sp. H14-R3]MDJ0365535.1 OmpA family protein [Hymenobacter sp. H14-R3]